ncbi:MAG: rRNA maturation RNase YbeY [Chloroflexi bacterium]|nr:rRNA maturation RNase YbeY [Chloroflexota bacterium]
MSEPAAHSVLVSIDDQFASAVDADWLAGIARDVLEAEGVPAAELGVLVTDDDTVRELNRRYAGEDQATDVLSFSLREGEQFAPPPDGVLRLGEVIISYPTAERQAREAGRSTEAEVAHLLVHGILHLLGYHHAVPEEERRMRAREEELLGGTH